ncbi:MAG TPA: hypothetical protein VGK73_33475 [Polyangiaceae bacterium]
MSTLITLSDAELVARLPSLVQAERGATLEVIEHLVEMERRRLYLAYATSSLFRYCIERLGYAEDAALKRHRVARLALRVPEVLEALRAGTIHLTGLFLLSAHLNEENAGPLLSEARDKSKRQIEEIIARWFPRPDVTATIERAGASADQLAGGQTSLRISDAEQPRALGFGPPPGPRRIASVHLLRSRCDGFPRETRTAIPVALARRVQRRGRAP